MRYEIALAMIGAAVLSACGSVADECQMDMCGVCDVDPSNDCVADCAGTWGGQATADMCGACDADSSNDCTMDCAGTWGGSASVDACGRCLDDTTSLPACQVTLLDPVADSYASMTEPTLNFGTQSELRVEPGTMETYLRFDLASLPREAVVYVATLHLTEFMGTSGAIDVDPITSSVWDETAVTWNARPFEDRFTDRIGSLAVGDLAADTALPFGGPAVAATVQEARFGYGGPLTFRLSSVDATARFRSREAGDVGARPRLEVAWVPGVIGTVADVADAYVFASEPSNNFGASAQLNISRMGGFEGRAFVKFDLGVLPSAIEIRAARIFMQAFSGFAFGGDGNVYTHLVADDTWGELTVSWANQPEVAAEHLGAWFLWYDSTPVDKPALNASPRLVPALQAESDGDRVVSFRFHSPGYNTQYRSREHTTATQHPSLEVLYLAVP